MAGLPTVSVGVVFLILSCMIDGPAAIKSRAEDTPVGSLACWGDRQKGASVKAEGSSSEIAPVRKVIEHAPQDRPGHAEESDGKETPARGLHDPAGKSAPPVSLFAKYRRAVEKTLKEPLSTEPESLSATVPKLIALYTEIRDCKEISERQKAALLRPLETRLNRLAQSLRLERQRQPLPSSPPRSALAAVPAGESPTKTESGQESQTGEGHSSPVMPAAAPGRLAFGGPPGTGDYAEELLDLIQRVVSPRSWARNGGQGQIRYWPPGQAIVVRQTEEVHEQLAILLEQLRRTQ
jgi:hypothetical protein